MGFKDLKIITIFAFLIIGIVFIGVIANMVTENTEGKTEPNEYISIAGARDTNGDINSSLPIALANDEVISFTSLSEENGSALALTTDYIINLSLGQVFLINNSHTVETLNTTYTNHTNATYVYQMDNYIENGTSRTIISLLVIFFAIGVLAIGLQALGLFDWKQF